MKYVIRILALLCLVFQYSCGSHQVLSQKKINFYKNQGYLLGSLEKRESNKCKWVIIDQENKLEYDPINLEQGEFSLDKNREKQTILFKFLPLRMKNRCKDISPISITEMIENKKERTQ